ncbi:MAG: hypothetical protein KJ556_09490 [Gammaproteobacteria bacterium]|nr:hypothetical protein [Gammaproteobacteria bacterium]MBU2059273.1 hypothetical protein [Gammaproteobacteria bacterium]MBU2175347.1 hypothetical protein [Gammaproteobacteria bacterium]MBU2247555.1 hypothetical protein [Gammaproteobacteria bacterium]MBU2343285.1 hypothetical protein [Gammaproteobacteria bacterium]
MSKIFLCFIYVMISCNSLLLTGCGGSTTQGAPDQRIDLNFPVGAEVPDNRYVDHYQILVFGNSHVRSHNLTGLIRQFILAGRPGAVVDITLAGDGSYLDERLYNKVDLAFMQSRNWTHVILQGQKYSTTGLNSYPIDDSLIWLRAVKGQDATPVLFPEHGQDGNSTEGSRVHQLHQTIVAVEPGCIAPVGLAWDKVWQLEPRMVLHEADGNHAALAGTFLTALVFYQSITGNNAESLGYFPQIPIPAEQQQFLRQIAAATLQQNPACPF